MQSVLLWVFAYIMLIISIVSGGLYKENGEHLGYIGLALVTGTLGLLAAAYA